MQNQSDQDVNSQIIGRHAVMNALKKFNNSKINQLMIQEGLKSAALNDIKKIAAQKKVIIKFVPKSKLDKITDNGTHQGVVLKISPLEYVGIDSLVNCNFVLMLDNIVDPYNFGSLIRSADAAGVEGIIIPKRRSVPVTETVWKASTGAASFVPIARVSNLSSTITDLKEAGFWFFGADMNGTNWLDWNINGKICLIIGNEGSGISPVLRDKIDEFISIPMFGHVDSLNASVAGGSLMMLAATKRNI